MAGEAFGGSQTLPGAAELASQVGTWLHQRTPGNPVLVATLGQHVDAGEAEAIALAAEHDLLLLIDDLAGRRAARRVGVAVLGSAGVLGLAKRRGSLPAVRPALDDLIAAGLRLSTGLYRSILQAAGE
ncbi:MAG: DUF3368 domain-containing protein [Chloroflexota bacterium]